MKLSTLATLLLLLLVSPAWAQVAAPGEALKNGDFSAGLAHWDGDGHASPGGPGVEINLLGTWTKLTQDFEARQGSYVVTITFALSPGTTFSSNEKEYRKLSGKLGFTALKEFRVKRGEWCMIVTNLAARRFEHCAIRPGDAPGTQSLSGTVPIRGDDEQNLFCLAFPPGQGSITIQSVSMTRR